MKKLSEQMIRDLRSVLAGHTRGDSYRTCESLVARGLLSGDWETGYYVTPYGENILSAITDPSDD